jgi:hypothetical protein
MREFANWPLRLVAVWAILSIRANHTYLQGTMLDENALVRRIEMRLLCPYNGKLFSEERETIAGDPTVGCR